MQKPFEQYALVEQQKVLQKKRKRKNGKREKKTLKSKKCRKGVGSLSPKEISLFTKMHQNIIPSGHNSVYRVSWRVLEKVRGNESASIYILTGIHTRKAPCLAPGLS